jgi:hypothetical protein
VLAVVVAFFAWLIALALGRLQRVRALHGAHVCLHLARREPVPALRRLCR